MSAPQERWECPSCGTPLNIAALGIYAKVACPACGHIDHVHTMLANYRIEGVLGLGGMSVVLRARDLVLERPLAIKLLNEFYRDQPERIARFEQECELMAKVRHENVVSLYSAGRVRGQFYMAMELVSGRNLELLVSEDGPMEPLRALEVLREVVLGLQAAFKAGLLHRDMKPANIIICDDGRAKVLDFGLSHGKRDADTEEIIWATPYYVPPETLMREPEDARADIYALGMTLRHLLTGVGNFEPVPEGIEDMLACKRALPHMAEAMPNLPEAYCELVDHMTAFTPAERPDDYASLLEEIAEVRALLLDGRRRVPLRERLRVALPILGGAATTLLLGAGVASLTRCLATPAPELLSVTPAASLPWVERDTLAIATEKMQAGLLQEAAVFYSQLAGSEGEPAACAWAALHAEWLLLLTEGETDAYADMVERKVHHLERKPAPAGTALHVQMRSLSRADAAPTDTFLRAVQQLRLAEDALHSGHERERKQYQKAARAALREGGPTYAHMSKLVAQYETQLDGGISERVARSFNRFLAEANMKEAARALALQWSVNRDEAARAGLAVQNEALLLLTDAVEMMQRRSLLPPAGKALTPEAMPGLLAALNQPQLADELPVLMLMAQGRFAEAATANPYAQKADSREPFAVLMRDWLSRVKKP